MFNDINDINHNLLYTVNLFRINRYAFIYLGCSKHIFELIHKNNILFYFKYV